MLPLDVFDHTNVRDLLAAWLARQPEGGRDERTRWLGRQLGCERTQILNLLSGSRKVQITQVSALGRLLGVEGEALEYVRALVAFHNATPAEFKARHLSLWAAHAARRGIAASEVAALVAHSPVHGSEEGALLALLPLLCAPGSAPDPRELEGMLRSPPEPGLLGKALDLAATGASVGEIRSPRLVTLSGPGFPGTWPGVGWHGLYELARDALMAVPAEERDFHTIIWSADARAAKEIADETDLLGRSLASLVQRHAAKRESRIHLLMIEETPLTEILRPPGERSQIETGPGILPARQPGATGEEQRQDSLSQGRPCLFLYQEFPPFARAWIAWRDRKGEPHSFTWLGDRMKSGRSLAYALVTGSTVLHPHHVPMLVRALDLTKDEAAYLEGMARYAISVDLLERARERQALIAFAVAQGVRTWEGEQFKLASHWSPLAICALANLAVFSDNPAWISCALRGRICWQDVRDMMASMLAVGMLQPRPGGPPCPQVIERRDLKEIPGITRYAFQDSILRLLENELRFPIPEQRLRGWVFALPDAAQPTLRARLGTHKARVEKSLRDSDARVASSPQDRVLLTAIQLFPISIPLISSLVPKAPRP